MTLVVCLCADSTSALQACNSVGGEEEEKVSWFAIFTTMVLGVWFLLPWVFPRMFHVDVPAVHNEHDAATLDLSQLRMILWPLPICLQLRKIMMIKGVPWQLAHLLQLRRLMTQMLVS